MKISRRSVQIEKFMSDNLWRVHLEDINGYRVYHPCRTLTEANEFAEEWMADEVSRKKRKTSESKWVELSIEEDKANGREPTLD
tara:strand:+ start:274 stop:525 length:252 start_codon:yes stop_codon:yes gene_type:complete